MQNIKSMCKMCSDEPVYSKTLTDGMCLNCYQNLKEENRLADIECSHDYYDGCGII